MSGDQQHPELLIDPVRVPAGRSARPQPGPADLAVDHLGLRGGDDPQARGWARQPSSTPSRKQRHVRIEAAEGLPVRRRISIPQVETPSCCCGWSR